MNERNPCQPTTLRFLSRCDLRMVAVMPRNRKRCSPVKYPMSDRVDATLAEVAAVVLESKPKTDWRNLQHRRKPCRIAIQMDNQLYLDDRF